MQSMLIGKHSRKPQKGYNGIVSSGMAGMSKFRETMQKCIPYT